MSSRPAAASGAADNPFESRHNKKLKFNVLGRRVKGASRNVALARLKSVEKREQTLRPEFLASKKASSFMDRRFGEKDEHLDPETKMLLRLQKERKRQIKQSSKRSKFNLEEGADNEVLTHFGRALSDVTSFDQFAGPGVDEEEDATEDAQMSADVTSAHFGGLPSWRGKKPVPAWAEKAEGTVAEEPKSYKEIMEEIIAKSKAAKAERAVEKAQQESLLQRLDMQPSDLFRALAKRSFLHSKEGSAVSKVLASTETPKPFAPAPPSVRSAGNADAPSRSTFDDFDHLLHKIARENRSAQASNRTLTDEEQATAEAERLRELEALRVQRMRGEKTNPIGAVPSAAAPGGGDDLGPDFLGNLTYKQRKRAARGASIFDYSDKADAAAAADSGEDSSEGTSDASSSAEEESDSTSADGTDDDESVHIDELVEQPRSDEEDVASSAEIDEDVEAKAVAKHLRKLQRLIPEDEPTPSVEPAVDDIEVEEMPYVVACPVSLQEWSRMVQKYCIPPVVTSASSGSKRRRAGTGPSDSDAFQQVSELIRRIRVCNSIKVKSSNKDLLIKFYKVLLLDIRHCGELVLPAHGLPQWRTEAVFSHLFAMSQEPPLQTAVAAIWRDEITRMHDRVIESIACGRIGSAASMNDNLSAGSPSWLTSGELLVAQLALRLFPTSDFRHVVLIALELLLCSQLINIPIVNEVDMARGLATAAMLLAAVQRSRRYPPEVVSFVHSCWAAFINMNTAPSSEAAFVHSQPSFSVFEQCLIRDSSAYQLLLRSQTGQRMSQLPLALMSHQFSRASKTAASSGYSRSSVLRGCLRALIQISETLATLLIPADYHQAADARQVKLTAASLAPSGDAARALLRGVGADTGPAAMLSAVPAPFPVAPEVLDPMLGNAVRLQFSKADPLGAQLAAFVTAVTALRESVAKHRQGLKLHDRAGTTESLKMYAPLIEDVNAPHVSTLQSKAAMTNKEAAEAAMREEVRKLQKQKKRELRGAVRELRKDRDFIVREDDKLQSKRNEQRESKYREVMTMLQVQQATFNQMVKKGGAKPPQESTSMNVSAARVSTKADRRARKGASNSA
jgi:hypothetical protein